MIDMLFGAAALFGVSWLHRVTKRKRVVMPDRWLTTGVVRSDWVILRYMSLVRSSYSYGRPIITPVRRHNLDDYSDRSLVEVIGALTALQLTSLQRPISQGSVPTPPQRQAEKGRCGKQSVHSASIMRYH